MKASAVYRYDLFRHKLENPSPIDDEINFKINQFKRAQSPLFRATHPKTHLILDLQDLTYALNEVNKNIKHKNSNEILFIKEACERLGLIVKHDTIKASYQLIRRSTNHTDPELAALDNSISFLDFCLIAALSESLVEIDALMGQRHGVQGKATEDDYRYSTSALINKLIKLQDHYNQLFRNEAINNFATELISNGIHLPESEIIYKKVVRETGQLRFYDFVLYSPLFNILHQHACENPLGTAIPSLPKITICR